MKYRLIALDLDGTLKNKDNIITPKTKEALINAQKNGIIVVLASGRPQPGIRHEAKELEIEKYGGYVIGYNGACITNVKTKEVVFEQTMDLNTAKEMYDRSREFKLACMTYIDDKVMSEDSDDEYVKYESWINDIGALPVDSFKDTLRHPIYKVLLAGKPEYVVAIEKQFKEPYLEQLNICQSAKFFIEIMPKGINKAKSLDSLVKLLNIKQEEVIAFGDGDNDIEMIEYAGLGIAMGNASDTVKNKADFVTLSNNDDGIAYALDRFL